MIRLALYQPDIPQNAATLIRLGACLGVPVDIIEPCGFVLGGRNFQRAGMDYLELAVMQRHLSWDGFLAAFAQRGGRLILVTTRGNLAYTEFSFAANDMLLLGRETAGVPDAVHGRANARLVVPMLAGRRSLNLALAGAMVLGEALRQLAAFPARQQGAP